MYYRPYNKPVYYNPKAYSNKTYRGVNIPVREIQAQLVDTYVQFAIVNHNKYLENYIQSKINESSKQVLIDSFWITLNQSESDLTPKPIQFQIYATYKQDQTINTNLIYQDIYDLNGENFNFGNVVSDDSSYYPFYLCVISDLNEDITFDYYFIMSVNLSSITPPLIFNTKELTDNFPHSKVIVHRIDVGVDRDILPIYNPNEIRQLVSGSIGQSTAQSILTSYKEQNSILFSSSFIRITDYININYNLLSEPLFKTLYPITPSVS